MAWHTLETTHFLLHYAARNEATARRLGAMVEPIHERLSADMNWSPDEKTHVVLIDYLDIANGSAIPVPYNTIEIYLTPPGINSVLGDYDDWLRLVFTHEYTHILHLDQSLGPAAMTRDLLGRTAIGLVGPLPVPFAPFPNLFIPRFLVEGYATFDESRHTTAGRGDSAYTAMVLRMAVLDDEFFPIDKGSGEEGEWPGGSFRYLYGEQFLDYLVDKHGIDKVNATFHKNAWGLTPFLIDFPAYLAMDATLEGEWKEWQRSLSLEARKELAAVQSRGETVPLLVTFTDWETRNPRLAADKRTLYYTVANNYSYPHVRALDLATGRAETLFQRNSHLGPAVPDPSGRYIYYAQLETHRKFHIYGDVYRYEIATGDVARLTHGERILSLDIAPDGKHLVAVKNYLSGQALVLYRIDGDKLAVERTLVAGDQRTFDAPRFSPDGSRIAYASWLPGGYADVFVIDRAGRETRLTHDRYIDIGAVFTPDGRAVQFSSTRSGIYNLYRIAADATGPTAPLTRLTNVIGGAFESDLLTDDVALAVVYGGEGFNVARVRLDAVDAAPGAWPADRPAFTAAYPERFTGPVAPYAPGRTLWPRYWQPLLNYTLYPGGTPESLQSGVAVSGYDVLRFHTYNVTAYYDRGLERPGAVAQYTYDGFTPTLSTAFESTPNAGALVDTGIGDYADQPGVYTLGAGIGLTLPFPQMRRHVSLGGSYQYFYDREFGDLQHAGGPIARRTGQATLRAVYDSTRYFGIGIGPQDGALVGVAGRAIAPGLGADHSNVLGLLDVRRYFTLPHRQVIALQAQGGVAQPSDFVGPFIVGGPDARLGIDDFQVLPLRGFAFGAADGDKVVKGSAEYRYPLALIKRGVPIWGTFPFLADQLHGAIFAEGAQVWRFGYEKQVLASVGAELTFDFTVGYLAPLSLGLGVAVPVAGPVRGVGLYVTFTKVNF